MAYSKPLAEEAGSLLFQTIWKDGGKTFGPYRKISVQLLQMTKEIAYHQ